MVARRQAAAFVFAIVLGLLPFAGGSRPAHAQGLTADISTLKLIMAPTGKLRVGVYPGSPTSMVRDEKTGQTHGVSYEIGRELAGRLGVAFEPVTFPSLAQVIEGMRGGQVDFTVTNASAARAKIVDFTRTLLSVELGFLVLQDATAQSASDIDRPGSRIGVSKGSTTEQTLPRMLKHAAIIPAPTLKDAARMLAAKEFDAFATNKSILFGMSDIVPGSRVLEGRWGEEHMAVAVPKGRESAHDFLNLFVAEAQKSGMLAGAVGRAGLRGILKAQ